MASKKYLFMAGFITLLSSSALMAQDESSGMIKTGGYDVSDTSLIPQNRLAQQRDFLNNQYDFPAKPRNQWEVGVSIGQLNVSGDVRSKSIFNAAKGAMPLGFGLTVRKAWGYILSTRLQFVRGTASGFNYEESDRHYGHNTNHWNKAGYTMQEVYDNYKTSISELSLQAVASLNNLKFHTARAKASYYVLAGVGGMTYNTRVNALNGAAKYNFSTIDQGLNTTDRTPWDNRKEVNTRLKSLWDNTYETQAEYHVNRGSFASSTNTFRFCGTIGFGVQIKLSKMLSLQIEDKATWTGDDLVDGTRWEGGTEDLVTGNRVAGGMTRDMDNWNYFSVGLNLNLGGKSVSPLWWMNPLDYGYNEMKRPKGGESKCDNDADGDGISDCFDRCPNTPGGVSVDSHGCPFDTDGDGVPDYKDKQLITPTECQPVDADGVGRCPDPECCKNPPVKEVGCSAISSGSVSFAANSSKLSSSAMSQLNSLAGSMRSYPNCKAVITGNGSGSKAEQQRSWDRVNSVINYMVDKQGIDRDRFIFQYGNSSGDAESVDYRAASSGEEGPSNTPPPFPNLRKN
ncbi:MAG: OmpA family protein [Chitinophagaceae bacterium]|nr:OmpA family protein [Chitinophagaceae bacterium]